MVLYEIYREDGGNGITFVHMLYNKYRSSPLLAILYHILVSNNNISWVWVLTTSIHRNV